MTLLYQHKITEKELPISRVRNIRSHQHIYCQCHEIWIQSFVYFSDNLFIYFFDNDLGHV
jgi:hypothetical protein